MTKVQIIKVTEIVSVIYDLIWACEEQPWGFPITTGKGVILFYFVVPKSNLLVSILWGEKIT